MIPEEVPEITAKEREAYSINDTPKGFKRHGDIEFPFAVYHIVLSEMNMKLIRWHWHNEIELIYLKSGRLEVLTDESSIILNEGEGLFINQNVLHAIHIVKDSDAVFTSFVFHPSIFFGYGSARLSVQYLTPILENERMKYQFIDKEHENTQLMLSLLKDLDSLYSERRIGYELLCKSLLYNIWYLLLEISSTKIPVITERPKRTTHDELRIKEAIHYIENHFTEQITLDDIAASIHISKSECCRCFKRVLHITPFEYLMKYRIFYATRMMQRHDPSAESISSLAISVGFGNISYFNKVFKKYLQMTPTEFKKHCLPG